MQSYIKDRYQRVIKNDKANHKSFVSNWAVIKRGVPQGSVSGPALFLLYINYLPEVINRKAIPVLFVGDTSILCTHHNLVDFHMNSETALGNVNECLKITACR
jgi:hypothetical protein